MPRNRMIDYMMMDSARGGRRMARRFMRDREKMRPHYQGEDYARGVDYAMDYRGYNDWEYDYRRNNPSYSQSDYERNARDYESSNQYDRGTRYPFMVEGEFGRYDGHYDPYMRHYPMWDYAGDYGETLSKQEIEHWNKKLMKEVEPKDQPFFTKENISQKAKQMGIQFDKFSEEELAVATLMMYTDYCKTLGSSNMDLYIRLAKDWMDDPDSELQYGEKLASYYDNIVEGE